METNRIAASRFIIGGKNGGTFSTTRKWVGRMDVSERRSFLDIGDSLKNTYDTCEDDVIGDLYSPLLKASVEYVRAAGFFRSSVFRLMTEDLLDFAIRGGKMTLITSVHVDKGDYDSVMANLGEHILLDELREMRKNPKLVAATEMLAALVCHGCLSIKVGIRKSGMYHRKKGYFVDGEGDIVLFLGSGNETRTALDSVPDEGSAEDFSVYRSWGEEGAWESHGVRHYNNLVKEVSEGGIGSTRIVSIQDVNPKFFDFLEGEDWLDYETHRRYAGKRQKEMQELWNTEFGGVSHGGGGLEIEEGTGMDTIVLRPHQEEGVNEWGGNNFRGILKHATGSGKTITALTCINNHLNTGLPVLVLVPGRILLDQWIEEIEKFIDDPQILPVGSGHSDWRKNLSMWCDNSPYPDLKRVVVAIIDSVRTQAFLNQVGNLESALVVVDECHRIGAQSFAEICEWRPGKVLGLSATPERYGDSIGTERVLSLCGEIIHEYGLQEAIRDGYLTEYFYNIERVSLNDAETKDYDARMVEITWLLSMYRDSEGNVDFSKLPQNIKVKIFQAKTIIKKAKKKTEVCAEIISDNYIRDDGQNWIVYCQDREQLADVRAELENQDVKPIYEFWSEAEGAVVKDEQLEFGRRDTLQIWEATGGIMLAIQCLDEGVNIPSISHGVVLASSQNPRQFIQRRGRLLRLSGNKMHARIWDALVIPKIDSGEYTNYVLNELNRAWQFARNAAAGNAIRELTNIRHELGLKDGFTDGTLDDGSEEDDENE